MKKKRTLLTIFSFIMIALMCVLAPQAIVPATAAEVDTSSEEAQEGALASGACGKNHTWVLSSDGTLTISGSGAMPDWTNKLQQPWHTYAESIVAVVLEEGVTTVGNYAFLELANMQSVTLPSSLTSIRWACFYGCSALAEIRLPEGLTSIGSIAFAYCAGYVSSPSTIT